MRLSRKKVEVIKAEVEDVFGQDAQVWLFGSRVDDSIRGGDIDLLVEADAGVEEAFNKELQLHARLVRRLGDQKIDIVIHRLGAPLLPIHESALRSGERL
jgi:predicted nucleotidyltransferase